ncbi:TPA: DUF551 domain-containing protein [Klebsiella pneumoniae]
MTKSTITRERLAKIKSWRETYGAGSNVMLPAEEAEELARMALAAMDSEPVAEVLSNRPGNDTSTIDRALPVGTQLYRHAQPAPVVSADLLHTAASAIEDLLTTKGRMGAYVWFDLPFRLRSAANAQPVPVVPEEACSDDCPEIYPSQPDAWAAGWNACRAAMLAAAQHDTPALNSLQSVDSVTGGWIPVSERMPEDEQEVLTINRMGHRFVSFFDKHSGLFFDRLDAPAACCIEHVLVTNWMPLPAGPQEVR